jgi:hypothetical protein
MFLAKVKSIVRKDPDTYDHPSQPQPETRPVQQHSPPQIHSETKPPTEKTMLAVNAEKRERVIKISKDILAEEGPMPITALASKFKLFDPDAMPVSAYVGKGKYAKFLSQHPLIFTVNTEAQTVWLTPTNAGTVKDEEPRADAKSKKRKTSRAETEVRAESATLQVTSVPADWSVVNLYFAFQVFGFITALEKEKDSTDAYGLFLFF